jgi:SNF2 family DNA or RNA helicase
LIIYDEIHRLKNRKSAVHIAAQKLHPLYSWGLTGTPLENTSEDLISLLQLIDRKRVADSDRFLPSASVRSLASQYMLRRSKSAIADELRSVTEKIDRVPLTEEQRRTYSAVLSGSKVSSENEWIAIFNKLRDVCDFDPVTRRSSKIERAVEIIYAISQIGQKVVVFSYRLEPLEILGSTLSGKFDGQSYLTITGDTDPQERTRIVSQFQNSESPFILLCSMRATAEGLTLTKANHVIFINEWWNPALNRQARDRVNRIGQTQEVFVYRIRTVGTVESRLEEILKEKRELFDDVVERLSVISKHPRQQPIHPSLKSLLDDSRN